MHNAYFSSVIYTVRCKESYSLPSNAYSNFWCERFDRTPSHCSSCCGYCDCCALSTYRVPIKPILLNGLRQSALLQLSASRRLTLGCEDQCFSRTPAYSLLRGSFEVNCSANERTVCNRSRRRIKGRCYCAASQKGRENFRSVGSDDCESVLSILSDEADKVAIDVKWKNVSSSKRTEADKKRKNLSREKHLSLAERVETEKNGNLKQHETSAIDLRRAYERPNKDREAFTKSENQRKRRDVSSCSSYYSLSSGDFESDLEAQQKIDVEEFSQGYKKDEANNMEGKVNEEFNRKRDDLKKVQGISKKEKIAFAADIDWNMRKKSEKKLEEGTMQERESTGENQGMHSRVFTTDDSGYVNASTSQKRVSDEENSSFVDYLDKKTNKAYIQTGNRRTQHSTDIEVSGCDEVETALSSRRTSSGRKGNLEISETLLKETSDEHRKFIGSTSTTGKETLKSKKTHSGREENLQISETHIQETSGEHEKFIGSTSTTGKNVINRSSQKYIGNSNIEDSERTSNIRMKNVGEKKISLSSVQGVEEQHQKGEMIITQAEERRRKSQQFSEASQAHGNNVEDTSIAKSRTSLKNWQGNLYFSSNARATELQTDKRTTESSVHSKGYEHVSTSSEGYASDEKQVSSSQRSSEKVRFIPKSKLTTVVKTRESSSQTDERIFELTSEEQRRWNTSREESSFKGSWNRVSVAGERVISAEGDERSSPITLIPSSPQMGGGSTHVESTSGTASPQIFLETLESGSFALYDKSGKSPALLSGPYSRHESDKVYSKPSNTMAPEDALGSAGRLAESSSQFVDEFVERVRHDVTTSETQEMEVTGTNLAFDVEGNRVYSSTQQGTPIYPQSKKHDSSRSSGLPGIKGPADEMWDVTEPSVEQVPVVEEPEINKETAKPIVNRTGRSLWSIISDVVRLRWGSRPGSSTSAGRSGERNSPNKSDSETWFSGQEHEETSKSNVLKETSVSPETMSSDKLIPGIRHPQTEGEVSDTQKLKEKVKHLEVGSSSSNRLESGSTSVAASYASGEENAILTEDGKVLKESTSGTKNIELPISLPARGQPIVGEIVNISGPDMSGIEPVVEIKDPVAPVQSELSGSERKDGELKQRKFQRNKQVGRDRFDDWDEAYKVELEQRKMDEMFMNEALLEARKAADAWEVPVGAVLVQDGKIIARGCNLVEESRDSTAHAEMICIREASKLLHTWRLSETTLYVTLEPCPMCAGAILQARVDTVVWGAPNKLLGADGSWIRLFPDGGENVSEPRDIQPAPVHPFHPNIKIRRGVLATECANEMQQFFQLRRKKNKEESSKEHSRLAVTHHHPSKLLNKIQDMFHVMFCL
ncbi:tRNA(adenine(34)) deaminase, chloroplastic [Lotus japonicus]|uniref:tRNA(adenine(34)) deaminase, chloroplastic n=1 Tax=Lotus japonicus TaxID=34305 RepID=UPI00258E42F3|nr:tRNA(adenine(34)) deaminase, chloroplastic [Lotus japonicus]